MSFSVNLAKTLEGRHFTVRVSKNFPQALLLIVAFEKLNQQVSNRFTLSVIKLLSTFSTEPK